MLPSPLLVFAVLLVALVDRGYGSAKWGYSGPFGPYNWRNVDTSPNINQCGDKLQSPVDLDDRYAEFDSALGEINFNGYDQELYNPYMINNGHTVQIAATEDSNRFIEGARLPGRFQFAQFHLHWGANSSRGSEHTIRGFQYPLELHFVHFNTRYGSPAESMKYEDGLAVVAVYFEVSPTANEDLSVVVDSLKEVRFSDEKGFNMQRPVVLNRFLPRITRSYYRYQGSLTTPPCSQAVTFLVMTTTVPISEEQLQQFRLLRMGKDENSSFLVDNFRPTFPLNGRRVFKSFPSSATRPGLGPEGFPSLQDADDSYDILSESGFDDRFKELASLESLAQGVGEVVRRCNYVRSFVDWPRHSRVCAPVWNAFQDPLGLTTFTPQPLVLAPSFYQAPFPEYYQLLAFGKKKKK